VKNQNQNTSKVDVKKLANDVMMLGRQVNQLHRTMAQIAQNNDIRSIRNTAFFMSLETLFEHPSFWENIPMGELLQRKREELESIKGKEMVDALPLLEARHAESEQRYQALPDKYKQWVELIETIYLTEIEIFQMQLMAQAKQQQSQEETDLQLSVTDEDTEEVEVATEESDDKSEKQRPKLTLV